MSNSLSMSASRLAACIAALAAAVAWGLHTHAARAAGAADAPGRAVVTVQTVAVRRDTISQPVRAYGVVETFASNLTTIDVPYVARIAQMRVQPGQTVARGAPLFVVQADPAAVLAAAQAKSAAVLAQGELARTQSLYDKGLATQSQLATAKKALQDAQQALAAQRQTGIAAGGKTIVAPSNGVVLQVNATQGDQLQPGATILQFAASGKSKDGQGARPNVMLGIEPSDAAAIRDGDALTLHGLSTALATTTLNGRVVMVGASIDPQSQMVDIGANVPLDRTAFIPGTHVSADIATRTGIHWIVPRAAVLKDDHGEYVFQITPRHKAHRVAVVTRIEDDGRYGVDGRLDSAEPLVISGNYELEDGMDVRVGGGSAR